MAAPFACVAMAGIIARMSSMVIDDKQHGAVFKRRSCLNSVPYFFDISINFSYGSKIACPIRGMPHGIRTFIVHYHESGFISYKFLKHYRLGDAVFAVSAGAVTVDAGVE